MADWQPIETAPKDGNLFLGFVADSPSCEYVFFRWQQDANGCSFQMDVSPTHWMPLPEPPENPANALSRAIFGETK